MKKLFLFLSFSLFMNAAMYSQTLKEYKLDEIIISANRVETPALEVANTFTVITRADIEKSGKSTLPEILKETPGVFITEQGGPGRLSSVFMRGANSSYTLVMIDGVEMNDPSSPGSAFDLSSVSLANIERIEIIREPQSTLYGSDALAGIINIITRSGDKNNIGLNIEGGSYNSGKAALNFSGNAYGFKYFFGTSGQQSDGISAISSDYGAKESDAYSNKNIQAKVEYDFSNSSKASVMYRYTYHKTDLDRSGKFGDDPNYNYNAESQVFSFRSLNSLLDNKFKSEISAGYMKRIAHTLNLPDGVDPSSSRAYNNTSKFKLSFVNNYSFNEANVLTFGAETEIEKANTDYESVSSWGSYSSSFEPHSARTTGIFIQDKINLNNFFITTGARYDIHEKFGNVTTYRIAPAFFIPKTSTKLKATYATGFKTPSLFNLFDPIFGNPLLKPEKSEGFDAGIEQFLFNGNLSLSFVYFQNNFTDLIGFDQAFKPVNINKAKTSGIETEANYKSHWLEIGLSYTYTKAVDLSDGANSDEQLIRRPKHKALFSISIYPAKSISFTTSVRYIGKRYDTDFSAFPAARVELKDYTLLNASVSYDVFPWATIYLKANNILDTKYEEVLYYGTLGRSLYLGMNINY